MNPSTKVEQWFKQYKAEKGLPAETIVDEGELLRWLATRKPKLLQCNVSGSLPLSERFKAEWNKRRRLNWEHEYVEQSGCVNEKDCLKIVKALSGNDR